MSKEKSLKHAFLCASYDRWERAGIMNGRENARLQKQHRNIETLRNNTVKEHVAEKNRVKSRMESLRKTVLCRAQSLDTVASLQRVDDLNDDLRLPKLPVPIGKGMSREMDMHSTGAGSDEQKSTQLPVISASSPQCKRIFKTGEIKPGNAELTFFLPKRAKSHSELRFSERKRVEDINVNEKMNSVQTEEVTVKTDEQKLFEDNSQCTDVLELRNLQGNRRFIARTRSLGTAVNNSIDERINSFLGSVENCRISSSESQEE